MVEGIAAVLWIPYYFFFFSIHTKYGSAAVLLMMVSMWVDATTVWAVTVFFVLLFLVLFFRSDGKNNIAKEKKEKRKTEYKRNTEKKGNAEQIKVRQYS